MNQPNTGNINSSEYSVSHLPPSPSVTASRSLEDAGGGVGHGGPKGEGFNVSLGGTLSRELDQHHFISSTQDPEVKNGECVVAVVSQGSGSSLLILSLLPSH
jgi:hypothetical protein